jgi:hypothetical protein
MAFPTGWLADVTTQTKPYSFPSGLYGEKYSDSDSLAIFGEGQMERKKEEVEETETEGGRKREGFFGQILASMIGAVEVCRCLQVDHLRM